MSRPPLNVAGLLIALWYALAAAGILGVAPIGTQLAVAGGLLVGIVVLLVSMRVDLPSVFARSRLHYLLPLLPIAVGVVVVALDVVGAIDIGVAEGRDAPPSVALALLVGVALVVVGGIALVSIDNRYVAHRRSSEREILMWTAPIDDTHHRRVKRVYLASAVVAALLGVVALGSGIDLGTGLFSFSLAMGLMAFTALDKSAEYTALEGGVVVGPRAGLRKQFVPWTAFEGYERTDEAIVLRRRLPGTSFHCAVDALDDPESVVAVLDDRLDRSD